MIASLRGALDCRSCWKDCQVSDFQKLNQMRIPWKLRDDVEETIMIRIHLNTVSYKLHSLRHHAWSDVNNLG